MIHAIVALAALVLGSAGVSSLPNPRNAAISTTFRNIVVFGDSFSDDGAQGSPFMLFCFRSCCRSISDAST